jgi:hypothetical protein
MGIQAGNLVIKGQESDGQGVNPTSSFSDVRREASERLPENEVNSIKEPSIVVDGKVKKISKKSAFLLDMLTLDD